MTYAKINRVKNLCLQHRVKFQTNKNDQGEYLITMYHKNSSANFTTASYEQVYDWIKNMIGHPTGRRVKITV